MVISTKVLTAAVIYVDYGFEVFIVPHCVGVEYSVSGSDHVVFHDRYPGHKINPENPTELFLDVAHRTKYGVLV